MLGSIFTQAASLDSSRDFAMVLASSAVLAVTKIRPMFVMDLLLALK